MTKPIRMSKGRWLGVGIAAFAVTVSIINASWIAPTPGNRLTLVARRALAQPVAAGAADGGCPAARIRQVEGNPYIGNSLPAIFKAVRMGGAVAIDVRRTADGHMVAFEDETLDCRTDGKGPVRARTLAELKALDIGYGYTADGRTFPLRGRGIGGMPSIEEVLREVPQGKIVFAFKGDDAGDADRLVAAFRRAGMAIDTKYGFYGSPPVLARMKALVPGAWTFDKDSGSACLADYLKVGWTSFVPSSCRDTTVFIPLEGQWKIWGWPNRFQKRMADANSRLVLIAGRSGGDIVGLDRPEQLGDVPQDFRGHLWVEDFYEIGRALGR